MLKRSTVTDNLLYSVSILFILTIVKLYINQLVAVFRHLTIVKIIDTDIE